MTMKEILGELNYAILTNDKRCQTELYKLLKEYGIDKEEADEKALNIYIKE